jgi:uncharacterized membrane protein
MGRKFIRQFLSDNDLETIANLIGQVEKQTIGEIRVSIRQRKHFRERRLSLHELALKDFRKLGMEKTKQKTGVLIFLLISEKKFHIIADEGIHQKVSDGTWEKVAEMMSAHFRRGHFCEGICEGIEQVGEILSRHYPIQPGDTNELPNQVNIEG